MKTHHAVVVSLFTAVLIAVHAFTPAAAVNKNPPPTKQAPTGADCRRLAQQAADKVKKAGGTEKEQQAAYERAKYNCMGKM